MIGRIEKRFRSTRRRVSRSEWGARLLKLSRQEHAPTSPGLVLLQIDGLSQSQFEKALQDGHLPFLERLMKREHYSARSMFSGVPSSMSSVQAELLYGVNGALPGFSYYDRQTRRIVNLLNEESAREVESVLQERGKPLLKDGCAYAGILSGGASDTRFSMSQQGLRALPMKPNARLVTFFLMSHLYSLARTLTLGGTEAFLAFKDATRGLLRKKEFGRELRHIPVRVAVCILLRELSVIGAKIDLARGVPVMHINMLGYDEQAHRRGPSSYFAHWTLKGIDDAIARIWRAAKRAGARDYDVWIYSGHGQEDAQSYRIQHGRSVHETIARTCGYALVRSDSSIEDSGISLQRIRWLKGRKTHRLPKPGDDSGLAITAVGTLGHVYFPQALTIEERSKLAQKLVSEAAIPMVATAAEDGQALAWTAQGEWRLPQDALGLCSDTHPFPNETAEDLVELAHHEKSGDLIICGWAAGQSIATFPLESGGHGGAGPEETSGFVLLPDDAPVDWRPTLAFRPLHLHKAAWAHLHQQGESVSAPALKIEAAPSQFRIMTYNVHSCVGMDGRIYPERVARVIAQYQPDVVALQEIDVEKVRTGQIHQAEVIARALEMEFHFHPSLMFEREKYGDAVLSRHPMKLIKAEQLPGMDEAWLEPRGAVMVEIEAYGRTFRLINTHLSLSRKERVLQAQALVGEAWVRYPGMESPVIVCGDFNAMPRSAVCRLLSRHLNDAQECGNGHRPQNTFFTRFPVGRIDHVFVDKRLKVEKVLVPSTHLTRETSDHLPLIVDIRI